MEMNDLLKWGLVAGAAWFLITKLDVLGEAAGTPVTGGPQPAGLLPAGNGMENAAENTAEAAATPAGTGDTVTAAAADLRSRLVVAAGTTSGLNWDQWNYYHQQLTGSYASLDAAGLQRVDPMPAITVDQFLGYAGMGGLSPLYQALADPGSRWVV